MTTPLESLREQLACKDSEIRKLRDEIEQMERHDLLTGVMNGRAMVELLDAELQRSHRTGHPFCFAVINLDHFSRVNTQYGRPAGDAVLRMVSDASVQLLRALDRFGRLGDDGFGILLPATWLDSGETAMSRLRAAVDRCDWTAVAPEVSVTFSAGLTTNAPTDTPEKMITRAEQALRRAKAEGRNRTVSIEEPIPGMATGT